MHAHPLKKFGPCHWNFRKDRKEVINMKPQKTGIFLLVFLLAAMAMVPIASAADSSDKAPDSRADLINHLMHQKMTIGQYYEKVSPEVLEGMPEPLRNRLYETEMKWPETLSTAYPVNATSHQTSASARSAAVDIMALSESGYGTAGSTVSFLSRTFTSPSGTIFPFMHDNSQLLKWNYGTSQWEYVTSRDHNAYAASYNAASGTTTVQPGTYTVFGQHDGLFPLLEPYVLYTQSPIFTVS
jgi:hypothetical protein